MTRQSPTEATRSTRHFEKVVEVAPQFGAAAASPVMPAHRHLRGTCPAWRLLSTLLLLPLLSIPHPAAAQDCSIYGEQWNDIRLFRRCLEERGLGAWEVSATGRTVLHNAALQTDNPTIIVLLLEAGSDANARDDFGSTPLHSGVQNRNPVVTSHLLASGSDPNAENNDGYTPLHFAHLNANARVTALLLDAGANPQALSNDGWTPFHSAVFSARSRALSEFLERGVDFNFSPLQRAILLGDSETTMSLLANGADATTSDDYGWNSLHFAVAMGAHGIVIAILTVGSDPDAKTENGLTALHLAADPDMVEAMVAAGAVIDIRNGVGRTPLHQAALYREAVVVEALLHAGADPMLRDHEGKRPADLAEDYGRIEELGDVMRRLRNPDTNRPQ